MGGAIAIEEEQNNRRWWGQSIGREVEAKRVGGASEEAGFRGKALQTLSESLCRNECPVILEQWMSALREYQTHPGSVFKI